MPRSILFCCCLLLATVGGCTPSSAETASLPLLEGNWRNCGTAYQYYNAKQELSSRDTAEGKALGGMVITSMTIHLYRNGGEPTHKPWPYVRHGDTIRFTGGYGYGTILQLTPHQFVTKVEGPYPFADKTDTARDAATTCDKQTARLDFGPFK